jgi:hypothetical protein
VSVWFDSIETPRRGFTPMTYIWLLGTVSDHSRRIDGLSDEKLNEVTRFRARVW